MSLKDFSKTPISRPVQNKNLQPDKKTIDDAKKLTKQIQEQDEELVKDIEDVYSKYASMEEGDLVSELQKVTSEQKRLGALDDAQIDNAYNMLYPMLDDSQRQKLDNIIKLIK